MLNASASDQRDGSESAAREAPLLPVRAAGEVAGIAPGSGGAARRRRCSSRSDSPGFAGSFGGGGAVSSADGAVASFVEGFVAGSPFVAASYCFFTSDRVSFTLAA
jgi:hypothetical protein